MNTTSTSDLDNRTVLSSTPFLRMLALACVALVTCVLAIPSAHAAGANGTYRLTSISAKFTSNGQPVNIPAGLLESALLQNGKIVIEDNEVPIFASKWSGVLEQFDTFGFEGKVKVSGPKKFTLKKSGKNYVGKASKPVSLSLNGTFNGMPISISMKINFSAKVAKSNFTMTVPVKVTVMGSNVEGTIVMKAKK